MQPVLGVIGTGEIARFHFDAFAATHTRVAMIADANVGAAQAYVTRFGARYTTDYRAVLDDAAVNTVVVLVPSPLHAEVVHAALEAGKHVVCEKTLTCRAADSLALGRLAQARGRCLFTAYMKRFFPAAIKARELVRALGHITSVYARTYQGVDADIHTGEVPGAFAPDAGGASPIMRKTGGGILVCGGSHIFDLLMFLVGQPTRVCGRRFVRPGHDLDFMFHAMLDLPGGGVAHFEGNWHNLRRIGYERRGWDERVEISGVNGRVILETPVWNAPEHNAPRLRHYDNAAGAWTDYTFPIVSPFAEAEKHFLATIAAGAAQQEPDVFSGYRVDQLIETAWQSAVEDRPLNVEWQA